MEIIAGTVPIVTALIHIDVVNATTGTQLSPSSCHQIVTVHADMHIVKRSMGAGCKLRLVNTRCHLFGQNFILQMFLMPGLLEQVLSKAGFKHFCGVSKPLSVVKVGRSQQSYLYSSKHQDKYLTSCKLSHGICLDMSYYALLVVRGVECN